MVYFIILLLAILQTSVNCDKDETHNFLEVLTNIDHKYNDEFTDKIIIIAVQPEEDREMNSDKDENNENKYVLHFDKYKTKPTRRQGVDLDRLERSKTGKMLKYQHKKKMEEIVDYLRDHYSSTNYFYSEMQRIQRQRAVKDKMREMVDYLEEPDHWRFKNKILAIFEKLKRKKTEEVTMWNPKTNDLVINVFKDPYNDGVPN